MHTLSPVSSAKTKLSAARASRRAAEIAATLVLSVLIHIKLLPRFRTLAIKTLSYLGTQPASPSRRTKERPAGREQNLFSFSISIYFPEPVLLVGVQPDLLFPKLCQKGKGSVRE